MRSSIKTIVILSADEVVLINRGFVTTKRLTERISKNMKPVRRWMVMHGTLSADMYNRALVIMERQSHLALKTKVLNIGGFAQHRISEYVDSVRYSISRCHGDHTAHNLTYIADDMDVLLQSNLCKVYAGVVNRHDWVLE